MTARIVEVARESLGVRNRPIYRHTHFLIDLDVSSRSVKRFLDALEREFGITFSQEERNQIWTMAHVIDLTHAKLGQQDTFDWATSKLGPMPLPPDVAVALLLGWSLMLPLLIGCWGKDAGLLTYLLGVAVYFCFGRLLLEWAPVILAIIIFGVGALIALAEFLTPW